MADNTYTTNTETEVDLHITRAQNRLFRLYERLGTWRAVQKRLQVRNVATVYNLAVHGVAPKNREERVKVFLPRHERKPKRRRAEAPEWLRRTRAAIRLMVKETRKALPCK